MKSERELEMGICAEDSESLLLNTLNFFPVRESAVEFAESIIRRLPKDWQSIITIKLEKSGVYSVTTVIIDWSEGTPKEVYFAELPITLKEEQDG